MASAKFNYKEPVGNKTYFYDSNVVRRDGSKKRTFSKMVVKTEPVHPSMQNDGDDRKKNDGNKKRREGDKKSNAHLKNDERIVTHRKTPNGFDKLRVTMHNSIFHVDGVNCWVYDYHFFPNFRDAILHRRVVVERILALSDNVVFKFKNKEFEEIRSYVPQFLNATENDWVVLANRIKSFVSFLKKKIRTEMTRTTDTMIKERYASLLSSLFDDRALDENGDNKQQQQQQGEESKYFILKTSKTIDATDWRKNVVQSLIYRLSMVSSSFEYPIQKVRCSKKQDDYAQASKKRRLMGFNGLYDHRFLIQSSDRYFSAFNENVSKDDCMKNDFKIVVQPKNQTMIVSAAAAASASASGYETNIPFNDIILSCCNRLFEDENDDGDDDYYYEYDNEDLYHFNALFETLSRNVTNGAFSFFRFKTIVVEHLMKTLDLRVDANVSMGVILDVVLNTRYNEKNYRRIALTPHVVLKHPNINFENVNFDHCNTVCAYYSFSLFNHLSIHFDGFLDLLYLHFKAKNKKKYESEHRRRSLDSKPSAFEDSRGANNDVCAPQNCKKKIVGSSIDYTLGDFYLRAPNMRNTIFLMDYFTKHLKTNGCFKCSFENKINPRCEMSNKGFCKGCYKYWTLNMSVVYYVLDSGNNLSQTPCKHGIFCKDKRSRHLAHFSHHYHHHYESFNVKA